MKELFPRHKMYDSLSKGSLLESPSFNGNKMQETLVSQRKIPSMENFADLLCHMRLCVTKGEARRLIDGGGVKINGNTIKYETPLIVENGLIISIPKVSRVIRIVV